MLRYRDADAVRASQYTSNGETVGRREDLELERPGKAAVCGLRCTEAQARLAPMSADMQMGGILNACDVIEQFRPHSHPP